jgi:DNA ligase-1
MLLEEVARTSAGLSETPGRRAKIELLAACLRRLRPEEVSVAVAYLSGGLPQGTVGVGWASLRDLPAPAAAEPSLELLVVDSTLERIKAATGKGARPRAARSSRSSSSVPRSPNGRPRPATDG